MLALFSLHELVQWSWKITCKTKRSYGRGTHISSLSFSPLACNCAYFQITKASLFRFFAYTLNRKLCLHLIFLVPIYIIIIFRIPVQSYVWFVKSPGSQSIYKFYNTILMPLFLNKRIFSDILPASYLFWTNTTYRLVNYYYIRMCKRIISVNSTGGTIWLVKNKILIKLFLPTNMKDFCGFTISH